MENIINKLTEIETAASAIIENAEAQKEKLDMEYEEKRKQFDRELEEQTQLRLKSIQKELEDSLEGIITEQKNLNSCSIQTLEKEYEARHTYYAQEILKRITEV